MVRQRIDVGNMVCADVTGQGDMVYGVVTERGKRKTTFTPHDGSEAVVISNDEVTKMTRAEYDEATKVVEVVADPKPGSIAAELLAKASGKKPAFEFKATTKGSDEDDEDQAESTAKLKPNKDNYVQHKDVKTASNRNAVDVDDDVAEYLRGVPIEECFEKVCYTMIRMGIMTFSKDKIPVAVPNLKNRYGHLNLGMQRMNLGNILRNAKTVAGVVNINDYNGK